MKGFSLERLTFDSDMHELYLMYSCSDQHLYTTQFNFNLEEDFARWLRSRLGGDFNDFFLVRATCSGKLIGFVHNYDFSLVHGVCSTVVYTQPEFDRTGLGCLAVISFIDFLFSAYPLRKVYSMAYAYNSLSRMSCESAGYVLEGKISDFRYFEGKFHDLCIYSISREQFAKLKRKLGGVCFA